jgi:digeranylgeranylglycerophospholipid reductase
VAFKAAKFDVIVVGAGPVGSATAENLARASLRVALLEEHAQVGLPNHCSGLVSPRTLELAGVSADAIGLARFNRARVWGPAGQAFWLQSDSVQAVAIDRPRFDQMLADRAVSAGATLLLGTRAQRFVRVEEGVEVEARTQAGTQRFCAPLLIGADGANSRVSRWMGKKQRHEIVPTVKADVVFKHKGTDVIEIFVGHRVAPGFFGWIIPTQDHLARIGIGAAEAPRRCFETFLDVVRHRVGDFVIREQRGATLPLGPARDFVGDRVMLVGAAARQTKPTTGGGIYFGLRAAALAAATAAEAIERGDCSRQGLAAYEQAWHRSEGRELVYGHWLRRVFRALSDRGLDLTVELLGQPGMQSWLSRLGDMDYPSRLLVPLATTGRKRTMPPRAREARRLIRQGA